MSLTKNKERGNAILGFLIIAAVIWGVSSIFNKDENEYDTPLNTYTDSSAYTSDATSDEVQLEESFSGGANGEIYYSNGGNQDIYIYSDCEEGGYCYGEDEEGDEVEIYVHDLDNGYGYGEDEYGNEIEFNY